MPPKTPDDVPPLLLSVAGAFAAQRSGVAVDAAEIGSRKARTLLKLLAVERGHLVPTDRIVDLLWKDGPPHEPADNVATLVSRLRKALGRSYVVGGRSGYRLAAAPLVIVDLDEAAALVSEAERRLSAEEISLAASAAATATRILARGAVLEDEPYEVWAEQAEIERRGLLRRARHAGALAALRSGDTGAAVSAAAAAIADDPWDEVAHRILMTAHRDAGEPARAIAVYGRLRERLDDELGVEPAPATRELYLAVLREEQGPGDVVSTAGGPGGVPPDARWLGPPLSGRDAEMARLVAAWSAAVTGQPRLVLLTGEAGIGKTRLAAEVASTAAATGGLVMQARCYETERALFLQPVIDAVAPALGRLSAVQLRRVAGDSGAALAELIPLVGAALQPEPVTRGVVELGRRRAFEAINAAVARMAEHSPVLLLLDDLQLAGRATVELLHYLRRHLAGAHARVLVVATIRRGEGEESLAALRDVAEVVEVNPLPAAAVTTLAHAFGQAHLVENIMRQTRGHTLFVIETLAALAAGETGIPETLQVAVLDRVRRAGPETEALLRAASVLGATLDAARIAALLELPAQVVLERCEHALAMRLLVVADRAYEFANDLVREVLYDSTPPPTRLSWHRRAADLLSGLPEAMAVHAAATDDWLRAGRAWLLAAEQAMSRFATADAEALASRAMDAATKAADDELSARAHVVRGRAHEARSQYRAALEDLEAAVALARTAHDQRVEMVALRQLAGDVPVALGLSVAQSAAHLERGLVLAEDLGDRTMEVDLLARLAVISASQLRFTDSLEHGKRAVAIARRMHDEQALAAALDGLKTAYAYLGEVDELRAVLGELEPLLRRHGQLFMLQWTVFESAFPAIAAAQWDEAIERVRAAAAINRSIGYTVIQPWNDAHLGWIERMRGDYAQAVFYGRRAVEATAAVAHPWWQVTANSMLATTLLELGERDAAITLLESARAAAERDGAQAYLLRCLAPLAEVTGSRGLLERADSLLRGIAAPQGSAWLLGADAYLAVARAWLAAGEPARARHALAPVHAAAARIPWVHQHAEASALAERAAAAALGAEQTDTH